MTLQERLRVAVSTPTFACVYIPFKKSLSTFGSFKSSALNSGYGNSTRSI